MNCSCALCGSSFEITNEDLDFYEKVSPVINEKKYLIPPPTICPECRMIRRLSYRNDNSLYRSVSALSRQQFISMYDLQNKLVIYDQKEWWSDKWDPLNFGRDFDFNKSFFEQFSQLQKIVPRFNIFNRDSINCEFVNYAPHNKNCYLIFGAWFNEDCAYGHTLSECKDCYDNLFIEKSEISYECIDCAGNYRTLFSRNCNNCTDCFFCFDCKNVRNSFGCTNLRSKENFLYNKPASKEDINSAISSLSCKSSLEAFKEQFNDIVQNKALHQATKGLNNENSSGDFLFECKNARQCFSAYRCEDIAYSSRLFDQKSSIDLEGVGKGELVYESLSNDFAFRSMCCTTCERLSESHYCDLCFECENCFGCIGLRRKQYCIFNKQYSKAEYLDMLPKIIDHMIRRGEWGEFFPVRFSFFGYNVTMAQEYFPLTKEEVLSRGWRWRDEKEEIHKVDKIIPANKLPESIDDIPDDILNWAIECEATKRPFRIVKQELEFYRRMKLPIPHFHPDERHRRRMALRNPRKLWKRQCAKCAEGIETSYSPDRPERVLCEKCYLKEVY